MPPRPPPPKSHHSVRIQNYFLYMYLCMYLWTTSSRLVFDNSVTDKESLCLIVWNVSEKQNVCNKEDLPDSGETDIFLSLITNQRIPWWRLTLVLFTITLTTLKKRLACFVRCGALRNAVPSRRISLASCFTFLLIHLGNLQCHRQTCWAFSLLQRIRHRVYLSGNLPGQYTNGFLKDCTH